MFCTATFGLTRRVQTEKRKSTNHYKFTLADCLQYKQLPQNQMQICRWLNAFFMYCVKGLSSSSCITGSCSILDPLRKFVIVFNVPF